jgi:DNA-binding CsgD family transcriptional regulator
MKTNKIHQSLEIASTEDLKRGFQWEEAKGSFICLFCGQAFEDGVIYQSGQHQVVAKRAAAYHVESEHKGAFAALIGLGSQYTGLSEVQEVVLRLSYSGQSDREVAAALGGKSESTVRNHRFQFRKRKKEAKIFLSLMELLEERDTAGPCFVNFPDNISSQDDRAIVTVEENERILSKHFTKDGHLRSFPGKQKAKLIILNRLAELFERGRNYTESEVNGKLRAVGDETGEIRRYLVDYGFLGRKRDGSAYWRV